MSNKKYKKSIRSFKKSLNFLFKKIIILSKYFLYHPQAMLKAPIFFVFYGPKKFLLKIKNIEQNNAKLYQKSMNIFQYLSFKNIIKVFRILISMGPIVLIKKIKLKLSLGPTINQQYQFWYKKNQLSKLELDKQAVFAKQFKYQPLISIIIPVFNTDKAYLKKCLDSVFKQSYCNWEICLADDNSTLPYIKNILKQYAQKDQRIKLHFRSKNGHISRTSNDALQLASGHFVAFLDHDDELMPNALFECVKLLNQDPKTDLIYSDEDKLELNGKHNDPFFKPDWSPDMFLSLNYLCHLTMIRKKLVDQVNGFRVGYEGAQDYDLFLRITELTTQIKHLPKILYSWRKIPQSTAANYSVKNYANQAAIRALQDALKRRKIKAKVENGLVPGTFRVKYHILGQAKVSIIIPTKDKLSYLKKCLQSILTKSSYPNYEILIVDTGSEKKATLSYLQKISQQKNIRVLNWSKEFNYSAVNNFAATEAKGKYLLFLNNDIEIINKNWIESLLEHAQRPSVGAVGAKLLYPNNSIQHAGIILGIRGGKIKKGIAGHMQKKTVDLSTSSPILNSKDTIRNFAAVTAACLMIEKGKFNEVGGFEEKLKIAFNDVDFNLKLFRLGYYNVYTPYAKLYHYESVSVGTPSKGTRDLKIFQKEINLMHRKWGDLLQNDPFFNPNFSLADESYQLKKNKTIVDIN